MGRSWIRKVNFSSGQVDRGTRSFFFFRIVATINRLIILPLLVHAGACSVFIRGIHGGWVGLIASAASTIARNAQSSCFFQNTKHNLL